MSVRGNVFGSIPVGKIGRTNFNLSHQLTGNYKEGICYPVFLEETLPGDSWKISTYNISKLETLIAPAMQRTRASLIWMKVPKRLCMKQFKKWYSGGSDGDNSIEKPYTTFQSIVDCFLWWASSLYLDEDNIAELTDFFFGPGSLWQNVGLPIPYDFSGDSPTLIPPIRYNDGNWEANWDPRILSQKIDLIPFNAYALCYMEYFRDQTLSNPIFMDDGTDFPNLNHDWTYTFYFSDGSDKEFQPAAIMNSFDSGLKAFSCVFPLFICFRRAWDKEYFTSALPEPQRGPEVAIPLTDDSAPVTIDSQNMVFGAQETGGEGTIIGRFDGPPDSDSSINTYGVASNRAYLMDANNGSALEALEGKSSELTGTADLSGLSPILITAFRNLFKLQSFLEKNNIAGGRFIEFILAHWAERVPDFTVQRPVFVRATSIPVIVSEVTATANSDGLNSQLGDQAGRAKGQGNIGSCRIYTQEPSIIIGLYCVTPPPSYIGQGIPKKFQRMTRWEEPYPEFQHIGEQAIAEKEIFLSWFNNGTVYDPEAEFGYQQRYSEFKYLPDRVVGDFATSLSYWHQARIFTKAPNLNQQFIESTPSERIFAVEGQRPVIADFWFDIKCKRKLSKFSTPKLN